MIQTLNLPYSSKTDEIMSRYRPIAPKPELPLANNSSTNSNASFDGGSNNGALVPEKFRQSPYLRNIWSHLQARPTRTRKRGRSSGMSSAAAAALLRKQQHEQHHHHQQQQQHQPQLPNSGIRQPAFMGLCSARNLSMQPFGIYAATADCHHSNNSSNNNDIIIFNNNNDDDKNGGHNSNNVVELPLLSCPMLSSKSIDLNIDAMDISALDESDLQLQLQVSSTGSSSSKATTTKGVISPRPVRPVGSTIKIVGPISHDPEARALVKAHDEVEAEAEAESLPAVITDRGNKVRMVNSAYKELVGQPECPWLDTMCTGGRISGEVMLQLTESGLPVSSDGFSCWVRIEWESNGSKNSVNAFCDVVKLVCVSKDYLLSWRFHTREVSPSGSKV